MAIESIAAFSASLLTRSPAIARVSVRNAAAVLSFGFCGAFARDGSWGVDADGGLPRVCWCMVVAVVLLAVLGADVPWRGVLAVEKGAAALCCPERSLMGLFAGVGAKDCELVGGFEQAV